MAGPTLGRRLTYTLVMPDHELVLSGGQITAAVRIAPRDHLPWRLGQTSPTTTAASFSVFIADGAGNFLRP